MPGGDKTGPLGRGRLTGRRQGNCASTDPRGLRPGHGVDFGAERGHRWSFGNGYGTRHSDGQGGRAGYSYGVRFQNIGNENDFLPGVKPEVDHGESYLSHQLTAIIDQLSELIQQAEPNGRNNEKS